MFKSAKEVQKRFDKESYICSEEIATSVFLALRLGKPLLVEGPAGVGKTELAKSLALVMKQELIRLQCYEGLDESKALYEWTSNNRRSYLEYGRRYFNWGVFVLRVSK